MNKTCYVYQHRCPLTKEVVYVGRGQGHRAWATYNQRSHKHRLWLEDYLNSGLTMGDLVEILHKAIDNDTSKALEKEIIKELKPKFNYAHNKDDRNLSLTKEEREKIKQLRSSGISYSRIANLTHTSTMTAWRAINTHE